MLRFVTFVGADERNKMSDLAKLSKDFYPVEWAVRYDPLKTGTPGFPALDWISRFLRYAQKKNMHTALWVSRQHEPSAELQSLAVQFGRMHLDLTQGSHSRWDADKLKTFIEGVHRDVNSTAVVLHIDEEGYGLAREVSSAYGVEYCFGNACCAEVVESCWPLLRQVPWHLHTASYAALLEDKLIIGELLKKAQVNTDTKPYSLVLAQGGEGLNGALDLGKCAVALRQAKHYLSAERFEAGAKLGSGKRAVSTLSGYWLDFWVAMATLNRDNQVIPPPDACAAMRLDRRAGKYYRFSPSENAHRAVELMEEELVTLRPLKPQRWEACAADCAVPMKGNSLEEAGLRAIVAKYFGLNVPVNPALFY